MSGLDSNQNSFIGGSSSSYTMNRMGPPSNFGGFSGFGTGIGGGGGFSSMLN